MAFIEGCPHIRGGLYEGTASLNLVILLYNLAGQSFADCKSMFHCNAVKIPRNIFT